jgi:hypothetical protein
MQQEWAVTVFSRQWQLAGRRFSALESRSHFTVNLTLVGGT